jgi:lipopolysaccharide transport system permease protein
MVKRLKKVYSYRHILWDMTLQQLKTKYAGSKLGIWWAVITPLLLAVSINFIFTTVFKINIPNYTFFILAGLIPWIFFTNALSEVANSFLANSPILNQAIFPRELVPFSTILSNL